MSKTLADVQEVFTRCIHPRMWKVLTAVSSSAEEKLELEQSLARHITASILSLIVGEPQHQAPLTSTTQYKSLLDDIMDAAMAPYLNSEADVQAAAQSGLINGPQRDKGIEALFVLLASELVSFSVSAPLLNFTNGNSDDGDQTLPGGVVVAAKAIATAIFTLASVQCAPPPAGSGGSGRSTRRTRDELRGSVASLWHTFLLVFLQQLSARNGDLPLWSQFFAACEAEASSTSSSSHDAVGKTAGKNPFAISDDEDDENEEVDDATADVVPEALPAVSTDSSSSCAVFYIDVSAKSTASVQLDMQQAWAYLAKSDVMKETVARTRFRRAALLFRSFTPHMVTQAPGTSFFIYNIFLQFGERWQHIMRNIPMGSLSEETLRSLGASWEASDKEGEAAFPSSSSLADDAEKQLLDLVEEFSKYLGSVLGDSAAHGYLLCSVVGAYICAAHVMPLSRVSTTSALSRRPTAASIRSGVTTNTLASNGTPALLDGMASRTSASQFKEMEAAAWLKARPDTRKTSFCAEREWRLRQFPPIGLLLRRLRIHTFCQPHLFFFSTQLRIGMTDSHHIDCREKLALFALLSDVCNIRTALLMYHYAMEPPQPSNGHTAPVPTQPFRAVAQFTTAMRAFAAAADSELIFDLPSAPLGGHNESAGNSRRDGGGHHAVPTTSSSTRPRNGELRGERFCRMRYPSVVPAWSQFVASSLTNTDAKSTAAAAASGASLATAAAAPLLVSPCRVLMELIASRYFGLCHMIINRTLLEQEGVDVFLVPKSAMRNSVNVQVYIAEILSRCLASWEDQEDGVPSTAADLAGQILLLRELLPIASAASSYIASQSLFAALLTCLVSMCGEAVRQYTSAVEGSSSSDNEKARKDMQGAEKVRECFALAEHFVVQVVMPGMRVMGPSPALYDHLQGLFALWEQNGPRVNFGASEGLFLHWQYWLSHLLPRNNIIKGGVCKGVVATRPCPHVTLRCKEQEALFQQSLKRINDQNVDHYRQVLRPVLYAEPLYVAERLLAQAVGYENSFLALHTRLLQGLPPPIIQMVFTLGMALMHRYASEERLDAENTRVATVATFLATLWRNNLSTVDGSMLVRAVEVSLRADTRQSMIVGVELLRALLLQLSYRKLEHEEQFTPSQLHALVAPSAARRFAKGSIESFRMTRWSAWLTPADLHNGYKALVENFNTMCNAPLAGDDDDDDYDDDDNEEEKGTKPPTLAPTLNLSLGQHIVLHLCRLHSRIYELQADLEGSMELVLLTSGKDFNVLNDLIFAVEEFLLAGPPESLLCAVAMPNVALRLSARNRLRASLADCDSDKAVNALFHSPPPSLKSTEGDEEPWSWFRDTLDAAGGVSYHLLRHLSFFTAAHLEVDSAVYDAAMKEWRACMDKAKSSSSSSSTRVSSTVAWLKTQEKAIEEERVLHEKLYTSSEEARRALLHAVTTDVLAKDGGSVSFVMGYLLPRAMMSFEDTIFVHKFIAWLLKETRRSKGGNDAAAVGTNSRYHQAAVDVALTLVTAACTFFTGFSDSESKRAGYLVQSIVAELTAPFALATPAVVSAIAAAKKAQDAAAAAALNNESNSNAAGKSQSASTAAATVNAQQLKELVCPSPRGLDVILAARKAAAAAAESKRNASTTAKNGSKTVEAEQHGEAHQSQQEPTMQAYLVQLEAYICRALAQGLGNFTDVPAHVHRNLFLVLERMDKRNFPSTQAATELLLRVVAPHAENAQKPSYASATAVTKALRDNLKHKRSVILPLTNFLAEHTQAASSSSSGNIQASDADLREAQRYFHVWRMREGYMTELLAEELLQFNAGGADVAAADSDSDSDNEEDKAAAAAAEDQPDDEAAVDDVDDDALSSHADSEEELSSSSSSSSCAGDSAHSGSDDDEEETADQNGHGQKRGRSSGGDADEDDDTEEGDAARARVEKND